MLHLNSDRSWGKIRISSDATAMYLELHDVPAAAALRMLIAMTSTSDDGTASCGERGGPDGAAVSALHDQACSLHPSASVRKPARGTCRFGASLNSARTQLGYRLPS